MKQSVEMIVQYMYFIFQLELTRQGTNQDSNELHQKVAAAQTKIEVNIQYELNSINTVIILIL